MIDSSTHHFQHAPESLSAFGMGLAWLKRGERERAESRFLEAIERDPTIHAAYVELMNLWREDQAWDKVAAICSDGVERFPATHHLHKGLTEALFHTGGFAAAQARYRMTQLSDSPPSIEPDDVLACLIVRNERARVPWFIEEGRRIGIDHFFVVDNGSTDGTIDHLLAEPDVHLWATDLEFKAGQHGAGWFEVLMHEYGDGHWIVTLDADEILYYPGYEHLDLHDLTRHLDEQGYRAMSGLTLDMYSDRPLAETVYPPGEDFLAHAPFFDRVAYHKTVANLSPFNDQVLHLGGLRHRVFDDETDFWLTKTPLLRYDRDVILVSGQHFTSHPVEEIAEMSCAVLHFKYFSTFADYVADEVAREQHAADANCYKAYAKVTDDNPDVVLYDPVMSLEFAGSSQLVELGLVQLAPGLDALAGDRIS